VSAITGDRPVTERPVSDRRLLRFAAFGVVTILSVSGLTARLAYLQITHVDQYAQQAIANTTAQVSIPSTRGLIYDRAGRPLVVNVPTYTIKIRPADLPDDRRDAVVAQLASLLKMDAGDINAAIDAFLKGLAAKVRTPEQETVLCFEIGAAFEAKRVPKEALTYYQRVVRRDPKYRDVQDRIRRLQKSEPKAPVRAMAVGAENDDEIDRAFDEIIGTGDKKK